MKEITLKELLDIAKENLQNLSTLPNPDFRLEQAEFNRDEKEWEIVVSYLVENTNKKSALSALTDFQFHRIYKKMKIDENKEIKGFYIFNN
jgi:hypothetical protein